MRRPAVACAAKEAEALLLVSLATPLAALDIVASGEGGEGLHQLRLAQAIDLPGAGVQRLVRRTVRVLLIHFLVQLGGDGIFHRVAVELDAHGEQATGVLTQDLRPRREEGDLALSSPLLGIRGSARRLLVLHRKTRCLQAKPIVRRVDVVHFTILD